MSVGVCMWLYIHGVRICMCGDDEQQQQRGMGRSCLPTTQDMTGCACGSTQYVCGHTQRHQYALCSSLCSSKVLCLQPPLLLIVCNCSADMRQRGARCVRGLIPQQQQQLVAQMATQAGHDGGVKPAGPKQVWMGHAEGL